MHSVAPRTGPDEVNVAEEQHEYRQLVAAPYMHTYAERLPPAYTLLTRWRFTPEDRVQVAAGEDLYLAVLTFGNPLQPLNIQVGPSSPTDWRVGAAEDGESLSQATAQERTGPNPVMSAEDWRAAATQVERGKDADVHKCVIALGNHALADGDPQKFTHEHVDLLRGLVSDAPDGMEPALLAIADLLDNYLPPR
jgi:hypothetical protein